MRLIIDVKMFQHGVRAIAITLALALAGCDSPVAERPLRVSANSWIGYEPFFIAEAKGFFDPGSVHLIETPFSLTLERALRGGTIDASSVSLTRAFTLVSEGYDITIVLVLDWSNGADKLLAHSTIKSVPELKGKRVGTELRTVNTYLLLRALQEYGIEQSEIEIVPMLNEEAVAAYKNDKIDAASVFGRVAMALEEEGANSIFDSTQTPAEIIDVLIVRTEYLKRNSHKVEQLIRGWLRAVDYLNTIPENEERVEGLFSRDEFDSAIKLVRIAGLEDNRSFFESNASRLNAVIEARRRFRNAVAGSPPTGLLPPVDPAPFFAAIEGKGR